ncbi:3-hydroxyacyl-CoA dehydrogenase [Tardiphaga sp.]|uniref:3-hydroxyacyl-CoA dehydrogenase n=1 Tax=Tardiphaga sp. TaxID=1926292 RepID=UPI0037D9C96E
MGISNGDALTIGVVGAGTMGRGIAQWAAQAGHTVKLFDMSSDATAAAIRSIRGDLEKLAGRGKIEPAAINDICGRIEPAAQLEDFAPCHLAVEAIVEDLQAKIDLFRRLEAVVSGTCVLATNTSSLSVAAIASAGRHPERFAGLHFFNPVPVMKIVEVIGAPATDDSVVEHLTTLCRRSGHTPVVARDMPGFIINHAGRAFGPEALRIMAEGTTSPEVVDLIMRESAGFRMGPFQLFDLIGLDVSQRVMNSIYNQFLQEPRFRPVALVAQRVAAGLLGRKSGRGFYDYSKSPEPPAPRKKDTCPVKIWISQDDPDMASALRQVLAAGPAQIDEGDVPGAEALILVTPLGADATTTAIAQNLDPRRTVAVDMLFPAAPRLTIMGSPVVGKDYLSYAEAALEAGGRSVSMIEDSPGFVAQRIVSQIVSIGSDIAQQRIASPADIDLAVRLGLGYPHGPLELGDLIGSRRIMTILRELHTFYMDPCYRPSAWLQRRSSLGVSLRQV